MWLTEASRGAPASDYLRASQTRPENDEEGDLGLGRGCSLIQPCRPPGDARSPGHAGIEEIRGGAGGGGGVSGGGVLRRRNQEAPGGGGCEPSGGGRGGALRGRGLRGSRPRQAGRSLARGAGSVGVSPARPALLGLLSAGSTGAVSTFSPGCECGGENEVLILPPSTTCCTQLYRQPLSNKLLRKVIRVELQEADGDCHLQAFVLHLARRSVCIHPQNRSLARWFERQGKRLQGTQPDFWVARENGLEPHKAPIKQH
uniref:Chemokine interleukin-8-like domain-containing protein n=1 Tax=Oryctolagus cuniculus TaxID=9986 RepID=G1SF03_RABIT